ncbi:Hemin transport system permease protein HmuU [Planctomycetes bacterium Pan216]|uniref:Hemin transport system permease protein HmuU n=1 Tax=Kolteria novifilia TaxID=2527975 RepID=A0A518AYG3_9BACT|nr:Hemin transport system permease protein HmuU [Planctomycetes bacterium Pan216]
MSDPSANAVDLQHASRPGIVVGSLIGLLVAAMGLSIAAGAAPISPLEIVGILVKSTLGLSITTWEPWQEIVLLQVRLPRVLVGVLVGGGLAVAGAVMQGLFRNPMAEPGVIGISAGASLGAVISMATGWALASMLVLPLMAFVGAIVTTFLVYLISTVRGHTSTATLLLSGIAVGGIATAMTSFVLSISLPNWEVGRQIIFWLMGGMQRAGWADVAMATPLVLGGCGLLLLHSRDLNILALGEETALSLGINVQASRRNMLFLAAMITGTCVSASGVVVFVGLIVPHVLRLFVGPEHRILVLTSFLGGACLIVFADLISRTAMPPDEIRLGILTSLLGGPFFLYLMIKNKERVEAL